MGNISAKARLSASITVPDSTGMKRTFTISEGDVVKGLVYEANGVTRSVDGVVHIINYSISSKTSAVSSNTCYCKRGSQFASQVAIAALVVDSSNQYAADVNAIPINGIISIDSVNVSSLGVSGVTLEGFNRLTFMCDGEVDSVLWNNAVAEITEEGNRYIVTLPSMKKVNELRIFSEDRFFNTTINGIEPDVDRDECIQNAISAVMHRATTADECDFGVIVASEVGNVDSLMIGDIEYTKNDLITIIRSDDNSVFIPAFEVVDGLLKIAAPLLVQHADTNGRTKIVVSEYELDVPGLTDVNVELTLSATAGGGKGGSYKNDLTFAASGSHIDIIHERQDGSAYVNIVAATADGNIPSDTVTLRCVDPDGNKIFNILPFSKMCAISNSVISGAFTTDMDLNSRKVSYMFFIPEYGRFTAAIDTTESICRFTAATSDELTTLLEDPDAMVISLDGNLEIDTGIRVNRPGMVIEGNGNKLVAKDITPTQAGLLITNDGVIIRNLTIEATGDYALKVFGRDKVAIENVTAISHTKGAIQVNGSNVTLAGDIVTEAPWGGIEVCKSSKGAIPCLMVNAKSITCNTSGVPAIWVDKAVEDGLENAVINMSGILKKMDIPAEKGEVDQIWFK